MFISLAKITQFFASSKVFNLPNTQKKQDQSIVTNEDSQQRRKKFEDFVNELQNDFVDHLQKYETKTKFTRDEWTRKDNNGGGVSFFLQDGSFFEKASVNTTKIQFPFTQGIANSFKKKGKQFNEEDISIYTVYANGISVVIHPINPFVPSVHMNYRWMELYDKESNETVDCWFGGGSDMTPHYLFEEDCKEFHQGLKDACDRVDKDLYRRFKKDCDDHYFIKCRNERRGVGGIYFDDFLVDGSWEKTFEFVQKAGWASLRSFDNIMGRRRDTSYNDKNMEWKQIRRGRYVEYGFIYDKQTKFSLMTSDASVESILQSLPHVAKWEYNYKVEEGSDEEKMQKVLMEPVDWV